MRQAEADRREELLLEQLDGLVAAEARLYAQRADVLVELGTLSRRLHGADGVERYLAGDLAGTLRVGPLAAGLRLQEAERLHAALPRTLEGLRAGTVLVPQAQVLLEETRQCSEAVTTDAERRVFADLGADGLGPWIARKLRRRVKRCVLAAEAALEPELTVQREADARQLRRVVVRSESDAMASLWALLPADQLRAFTLGLDELSRRQRLADRAAGLDRTADQRRADLLALLPALALHALDGTTPTADGSHPSVVVNVHVPMATALGLSDAPGHLDGYGPVSAGTVRLMLPTAQLRKVVVDAVTGEPVHVAARVSRAAGRVDRAAGRSQAGQPQQHGGSDRSTRTGASAPAAVPEQVDAAASRGTRSDLATDLVTGCGSATGSGAATSAAASTGRRSVAGSPDSALRRALLGMVDDRPLLIEDVTEDRYHPSAALDRLVRVRDAHCTGIGCDQPSATCDLDHRTPWPLGPTTAANLAPLSRRCHNAKTASWALRRHLDGSSTWTSPTGRRYRSPSPWDAPPDLLEKRPAALPPDEVSRRRRTAVPDVGPDPGLTPHLDRQVRSAPAGAALGPVRLEDPAPF